MLSDADKFAVKELRALHNDSLDRAVASRCTEPGRVLECYEWNFVFEDESHTYDIPLSLEDRNDVFDTSLDYGC